MWKKTCYDTFSDGCHTRTMHPLPYGHYKLRESRGRLEQMVRELDRIQKLVSGRGDKWSLIHCTSEDKHIWLKAVPHSIAWRLGNEVLPGLNALTGDGVRQAEVDALYPLVEQDIQALLPRLEAARHTVSKNIGQEYQKMRLGTPLLKPLVNEAVAIAERALGIYASRRPMSCCV